MYPGRKSGSTHDENAGFWQSWRVRKRDPDVVHSHNAMCSAAKGTVIIKGFALKNTAGNVCPWPGNRQDFFWITVRTASKKEMPVKRTTKIILIMSAQKSYPEIKGTRAGYVIRFTCPSCAAESIIVNKMPQDHFRSTRVVSCRHCKTRLTVLTPYSHQ
ncbi:MAG: hypothetical protein ABSG06_02910 [Methanoregula sp.]|jgi:GTP cyclohydrolase FolE2